MSYRTEWERFGPWSLAPSVPKRAQPLLLGHARATQRANSLCLGHRPSLPGRGQPWQAAQAHACPRHDGAQQPGEGSTRCHRCSWGVTLRSCTSQIYSESDQV